MKKDELIGAIKNKQHLISAIKEVVVHRYPARKLRVIGVTGTDGKTTTAHLIYEILKQAGYKVSLISTIGLWFAERQEDTGLHTTTPSPAFLQKFFRKLVDEGVEYVVLEATSHGLDQHRVLGSNVWAGVLTNVTSEHLDYHKTFEKYRAAKSKLFRGVKVAVLNRDDKSFQYFKDKTSKSGQIVSYGVKANADLRLLWAGTGKQGLKLELEENGKKHTIQSGLVGQYNAFNIVAAAALARNMGIDWQEVEKAIASFRGLPGRMETVTSKSHPFRVVVDFAHTPNALKHSLQTLSEMKSEKGRVIAVFGSAGERDVAKRIKMGKISAKMADFSVFTAEDPRGEDLYKILDQMVRGAKKGKKGRFVVIPERWEAIAFAIQKVAKRGDVVGIFGKGHEQSLAFGGYEHPWSDIDFAKKALSADPKLAAIVLAAGKGTRMNSETPKVLHKIAGRPMVSYILETLRKACFGTIAVVVSYKKEDVIREVSGAVLIGVQKEPMGTGHAPAFGLKVLPKDIDTVMVVMGDDSVFYTPELLCDLVEKHKKARAKMTLASIHKKNAGVVGYIQRDKKGNLIGIKEWRLEKKPPPSEGEVNAGLYVFDRAWLEKSLPKLEKHENGEYFIVDLPEIALKNGDIIQGISIPAKYWFGVNNPDELREANRRMKEKLAS